MDIAYAAIHVKMYYWIVALGYFPSAALKEIVDLKQTNSSISSITAHHFLDVGSSDILPLEALS